MIRRLSRSGAGWRGRSAAATGERGFALLAVLWLVMALALIAASFASTTRTEVQLGRNAVENAKAEALAEAGVHLAILELLRPAAADEERPAPLRRAGTFAFAFDEGEVLVAIEDEAGKIDLNFAPDELLQGLLEAAGLAADPSAALVDAIADFRDPDDLPRLNGAEDAAYEAAGLGHGAKDAPFEAVEELQQVLGVTADLYRRIAPALTVYSESGGINPWTAPLEALLALPGATPQQVDLFLIERSGSADRAAMLALPWLTQEGYIDLMESMTYTVRAEASTASDAVFVRETVVRLTGDPAWPYRLEAWRRGERLPAEVADPALLP